MGFQLFRKECKVVEIDNQTRNQKLIQNQRTKNQKHLQILQKLVKLQWTNQNLRLNLRLSTPEY